MIILDVKDVLNAAYKLNDWLNFYWNFYVVFSGVVIGWVFNSKGWADSQRIIVSLFYLSFVAVSLGALYKTYSSLNASAARLKEMLAGSDTLGQALIRQLDNDNWALQLGFHLLGDVLVVACIWIFTKKPIEKPT